MVLDRLVEDEDYCLNCGQRIYRKLKPRPIPASSYRAGVIPSDEAKAAKAKRQREYQQRPDAKAARAKRQREKGQRPEVKAARAKYKRENRQRPEVKAAKAKYQREYWRSYRLRRRTKEGEA